MPLTISSPAANLHSPGPIGDVTPDAVNATSLNASGTSHLGSNYFSFGGGNADNYLRQNRCFFQMADGSLGLLLKPDTAKLVLRNNADSAYAALQTGTLNIAAIPASASGLSSGDVYSNAGILTIVP